LPSFC